MPSTKKSLDLQNLFVAAIKQMTEAGIPFIRSKYDLTKLGVNNYQVGKWLGANLRRGVLIQDKNTGEIWHFEAKERLEKKNKPVPELFDIPGFLSQMFQVVDEGEMTLPNGVVQSWQPIQLQFPTPTFDKALAWVSSDPKEGPWYQLATLVPSALKLDVNAPNEPSVMYMCKYLRIGTKQSNGKVYYQTIKLKNDLKVFLIRLYSEEE